MEGPEVHTYNVRCCVDINVVCFSSDFFKVPEVGELFDDVQLVEQSEEETMRSVEGYHREGKRNRERGEDPQHKRQRYDYDRRDGGRYGGRRDSGKYGMLLLVKYY